MSDARIRVHGCVSDTSPPFLSQFLDPPVCGNGLVEHGEQCDCGSPVVSFTVGSHICGPKGNFQSKWMTVCLF